MEQTIEYATETTIARTDDGGTIAVNGTVVVVRDEFGIAVLELETYSDDDARTLADAIASETGVAF